MPTDFTRFLEDDNEYRCPFCDGPAAIVGTAHIAIAVACEDPECDGYEPGGVVHDLSAVETDDEITFAPPSVWVVGDVEPVTYQCPDCGSANVERVGHDSGQTVDVEVVCQACSTSAWE